MGRQDRLERGDIGARPAVGEQHLGVVGTEELTHTRDGARGPRIGAVGGRAAAVGGNDRVQNCRVRAGGVVTGEGMARSNERHAVKIDGSV